MTISRNLSILADGASSAGVLDVTSGGTGVTTSSGANSVMLRDANQNVSINRLNQSNTNTAAAAGTTTLTAASSYSQTLTGTGGQTYRMPDATTLTTGVAFVFNNNATGTLTLQDSAAGSIGTVTPGGAVELVLLANGTVAGTWDYHGYLPENVTWGTNALALGSTVISGGTWQGGTIASGYGGTGLTTFTGANNALYSTSASALAAGTLPVLAGGTGVTTSTGSGSNVLSTSPTLVSPALGTPTALVGTNITGTAAGLSIGGNAATATTAANGGVTSIVAGTGISISGATGAVTVTNSAPFVSGPAFAAYQNVQQGINNSTNSKVLYQVELFDTNNNFASSRFTPTVAGYYQISTSFGYLVGASRALVMIYKNGVEFLRLFDNAATSYTNGGSALVSCNGSTDYIEIYVLQTGIASSNSQATSNNTWVQGIYIRGL